MIEAEISALLQEHGWYLSLLRKYHTRFFYAKRRIGKTVRSRYLKTEKKLHELTPEFVLERISVACNAPSDVTALPGANPNAISPE